MNISISEMAKRLKNYDEICIIYHIRPDGDCIGSSFALALALQSKGIKCCVCGTDEIPQRHRFMTDNVRQDLLKNPVYFAVDSSSPHRTGEYRDKHFTFCIDHHKNNSIEADFKYIEEDCGACSELIFKLIRAMEVDITKEIANFLYTAILTDTMCFRTSDTSIQTLETALELAKLGADMYTLSRHFTFVKPMGRFKVEDILRKSFNFTCDNKIVTGVITLDDLKNSDIQDSDLEGINSFAEQIEGIKISITIRELPDRRIRCSVRTGSNISANDICAVHGGGGHFHAACCELDTDIENARKIMEQTSAKFLL